ncbi:MAG: M48 family metalloprotease [Gammaproteobacteria bacterium]|nr:M48 family metalloprotease [Gammaproteobacteria bacterium]
MGFRFNNRLGVTILSLALSIPTVVLALDKDGAAVVRLSSDEYNRIVNETPVVSNKQLTSYLTKVAKSLQSGGKGLPSGVKLHVTLLDKEIPELYSLANGRLMITTGALFSLSNEAQLAAVLSHEVAHLVESHYPGIYQAFKAKERKQRSGALAAGITSVVVGEALNFTLDSKREDIYSGVDSGSIGYREANKRIAKMEAGAGLVEGFTDVYQGLPPETKAGSGDPRVPLEMVADAEGLKLLVKAGYDPKQAGEAWRRMRKQSDKAKEGNIESMAMSFLPPEMRKLVTGVEGPMGGIQAEKLTRSISQNPPDRPDFLDSLSRSKEIVALSKGKKLRLGKAEFDKAVGGYMLADARGAYEAEDWAKARQFYQSAWDAGFQSGEVAHRLGVSHLGGMAFAASDREKERAETYLLKAIKLEPKRAEAYKSLGELYGEWDNYEEAVKMYRSYIKLAPRARDKSRIERQIKKYERKARR